LSNNHRDTMKSRYTIAILCFNYWTSALTGVALSHGTENHDKITPADAQMRKLHAMMPMFSVASGKLEAAIERVDAVTVEVEAGKILKALPDLKKSKPHKNVNQWKKYVELATNLETAVATTVELSKKGDLARTRAAFKRIEDICAACHAKYRD